MEPKEGDLTIVPQNHYSVDELKINAISEDYISGKSKTDICLAHGIDENKLQTIIREQGLEEKKYLRIQKENQNLKLDQKIVDNLREIKLRASERVLNKIKKTLVRIDEIVDELAETGDPAALKQLRDLEQISLLLIKQAEACGIKDVRNVFEQFADNNQSVTLIDAKILQNINPTNK